MAKRKFILFPVMSVAIILFLSALSFYYLKKAYPIEKAITIVQDIEFLKKVIEDIDQTAGILNFDYIKNPIDFLNIKKDGFIGSEVGSINLKDPKKWQGPYSNQINKIKEENYMILHAKDGYFIIPADGVRLPNGKIVGKDFILDEKTDVELLMTDENFLQYRGKSLAARILSDNQLMNFDPINVPDED